MSCCQYWNQAIEILKYKTITRPHRKNKKQKNAFERKILWNIMGLKNDKWGWKSRFNLELYKNYKNTTNVGFCQTSGANMWRHVIRVENSSNPKTTLKGKWAGRSSGRPKKTDEEVMDDLSVYANRWKRLEMGRDKKKRRMKKAWLINNVY